MYTQLYSLAVKSLWMNVAADDQYLLKPRRLSRRNGSLAVFSDRFLSFTLPDLVNWYGLYSLGSLDPELYGIENKIDEWITLDSLTDTSGLLLEVIVNDKLLPLSTCYIKRVNSRDYVLAVKISPNSSIIFTDDPLYFRAYSNVWFSSEEAAGFTLPKYKSVVISQLEDMVNITGPHNAAKAAGIESKLFHNGILVDNITPAEINTRDTLCYQSDSSIEGYYDIKVADLPIFNSTVDSCNKYLVMPPEELSGRFMFYDDVDIYLCGTKDIGGVDRVVGFTVERYRPEDVRMVTRGDLSIRTAFIDAIRDMHDSEANFTDQFIRVYYRRNDANRPKIGDGSYLDQLYLLPYAERQHAMSGTIAGFSLWNASILEASASVKFAGLTIEELTDVYLSLPTTMRYVFSYHGVINALERCYKEDGDWRYSELDSNGCVRFFFDEEGALHSYDHVGIVTPNQIIDLPVGAAKVETLAGDLISDILYFETPIDPETDTIGNFNEVRYYRNADGFFVQAISGQHFTVADGKVTWLVDASRPKYKRSAGDTFVSTQTITPEQYCETLPLFGTPNTLLPDFGFGCIDIWLNGKYAIPNLDVNIEYPNFRVLSMEHGENLEIAVRLTGLPSNVGYEYAEPKTGWILGGQISRNDRYDVYVNTAKRMFVGGNYVTDEEIKMAETGAGTAPSWLQDGMPYTIIPHTQRMPDKFLDSITRGRENTNVDVAMIENAVSQFFPETDVPDDSIQGTYHLVSTLMFKIIKDIMSGTLLIGEAAMSDLRIGNLVAAYSAYIDLDPINFRVDHEYLSFDPHPYGEVITVSQSEYRFLQRVNDIYLGGKVSLNTGVAIG